MPKIEFGIWNAEYWILKLKLLYSIFYILYSKVVGFTLISLLSLRKRSCQGFTLIEVLVVIGIISVVSLIGIPNLRRFNQGQEFQVKTSELINNLKRMQTNSQAGIICDSRTASESWNLTVQNKSSYTLSTTCKGGGAGPSESKSLSGGIEITGVETNNAVCNDFDKTGAKVTISFINSNRSANFTGNNCISSLTNRLNIYLIHDSSIVGVTITKGGVIYQCQLNGSNKCT